MKELKYVDKWLLIITLILFATGLIMIFSASNVATYIKDSASPYKYLIKQSLILLCGLGGSFVIMKTSTKLHSLISWGLLVFMMIFLLVLLVQDSTYNGAKSWFDLGFIGFQPSEFIKVIMIAWMASYYEIKKKLLDKCSISLFPLVIVATIFLMIFMQPDFGTAIIFLVISLIIFFLSDVNKKIKQKTFMVISLLIMVGCLFLVTNADLILSKRQQARLDFRYPCSEEKFYGDGNQVCNSYIAINNGGLHGKGLGNSTQKYLYLPEAHTDFIFAIAVEELGLLVSLFILFLIFIVICRIIIIGQRANSNKKALLCYGVAFYIMIHVVINLTGITGFFPVTGVPLPFLSYGGSYTLSLIGALSMVQRINIETQLGK